jgi:superfamily I DNA/RNA helicase
MKWMITEDKLGRDQVEAIDEIGKIRDKPVWIKGHAGSGKSVLLLHALADYVIKYPAKSVCVVVFTRALVDLLQTGLTQIPKLRGKQIPVLTIYELRTKLSGNVRYDAIFCDEVQDLPLEFITLMKSATTHLIISGDAEQSIYDSVPSFNSSPASPAEITQAIKPIERNLGVIYRLTQSILNVLKRVFPAMLADKPNIAKQDTEIKLYEASSEHEEITFCWDEAKRTNSLRTSEICAILISGHNAIINFVSNVLKHERKAAWTRVNNGDGKPNYGLLNKHLESQGIPLMYIGNNYGSLTQADSRSKIVIMTYHSAKGLDFDYVYLPLCGSKMYIHSKINELLLVALSRSRSGLMITYCDDLYQPLKKFLQNLSPKIIGESANEDEILF